MLALLLGASLAHAFCGTYVGPAGSAFENGISQVVMARDGTTTTLTLANAYEGDTVGFGLVIPVPEVLTAEAVRVLDPGVFGVLDAYSGPRVVSYTCDQLYGDELDSDGATNDTADAGGDADGVVVEEQFTQGEYEFFVLSATGAGGLLAWLDQNGWELAPGAEPIVQEYIDAGQYFLAAKVSLAGLPESQAFLSPIQLRYQASAWALPVRIGTTVSPGTQEVVLYTLTPTAAGRSAISNYPEATLEDECMVPEGTTDWSAFYDGQLDDAFATGLWFTEYAWDPSWCDPCSSDPPSPEVLVDLGADWNDDGVYFTRLRARYGPDQVPQDLALYAGGLVETDQVRYIVYDEALENSFPVCGTGWVEDGGECAGVDDEPGDGGAAGGDDDDALTLAGGCACGTTGSAPLAGLALALAFVVRRRRR